MGVQSTWVAHILGCPIHSTFLVEWVGKHNSQPRTFTTQSSVLPQSLLPHVPRIRAHGSPLRPLSSVSSGKRPGTERRHRKFLPGCPTARHPGQQAHVFQQKEISTVESSWGANQSVWPHYPVWLINLSAPSIPRSWWNGWESTTLPPVFNRLLFLWTVDCRRSTVQHAPSNSPFQLPDRLR